MDVAGLILQLACINTLEHPCKTGLSKCGQGRIKG